MLIMVVKVLATVPDLICLLDVSTGEAIGTQEYRYTPVNLTSTRKSCADTVNFVGMA